MTKDLAYKLIALAKEKGLTIATAESCTGGLVGATITSIPGSSDVFGYGFITYSDDAKKKLLGVKHETLDTYSAISSEAAEEMAFGAIKASGADFSVALTGIAGPAGGSVEKPVGVVFIAVADKKGYISVKRFELSGDRNQIRLQSASEAIGMLIEVIEAY